MSTVILSPLSLRASRLVFKKRGNHSETHLSEIELAIIIEGALRASGQPELLEALEGVVSVADRKTVEFDKAHAAIAKAKAVNA